MFIWLYFLFEAFWRKIVITRRSGQLQSSYFACADLWTCWIRFWYSRSPKLTKMICFWWFSFLFFYIVYIFFIFYFGSFWWLITNGTWPSNLCSSSESTIGQLSIWYRHRERLTCLITCNLMPQRLAHTRHVGPEMWMRTADFCRWALRKWLLSVLNDVK